MTPEFTPLERDASGRFLPRLKVVEAELTTLHTSIDPVRWAGVPWRLALAALLCMLTWQAYSLRHLPDWITREADATRKATVDAITASRKDILAQVDKQATGLRTDVMARVDTGLDKSDKQLTALRTDVMARLDDGLKKADAQLTTVNGTVANTFKPVASVARQVDDAAPLFLDCDHNPDCAFNRFQGTSKAIEQMAQAGAKAAPSVAASAKSIGTSVSGIADDAHREADEFMKPKTFRQKVCDWLDIIPRIFRLVL